jgi:hypothetical protein
MELKFKFPASRMEVKFTFQVVIFNFLDHL